jgi:hypothetical protein
MRYNDVRNGTHEAEEVLEKYKDAWAKKGMFGENGLIRDWYRPKQDDMIDGHDLSFTAWYYSSSPQPLPILTKPGRAR